MQTGIIFFFVPRRTAVSRKIFSLFIFAPPEFLIPPPNSSNCGISLYVHDIKLLENGIFLDATKFCVKLSLVHLGQNEYSFTTFAHCIWDTAIMDFFGFITPPPFYNYNKGGGKGMYVRSGIALTPPSSNCAPTNSRQNVFENQIWSYRFFTKKGYFRLAIICTNVVCDVM